MTLSSLSTFLSAFKSSDFRVLTKSSIKDHIVLYWFGQRESLVMTSDQTYILRILVREARGGNIRKLRQNMSNASCTRRTIRMFLQEFCPDIRNGIN